MDFNIIHIDETDSTNRWLKDHPSTKDTVVWTDFQTAGRGCGTNTWESERGQNLLFSVLIHPVSLPANQQFHISMAISLSICEALEQHTHDISIKWPNDIYWRDRKICGILIEHTLKGSNIKDSIIGIGLNVNQQVFHSDAPNPVSLWQITGQETDREQWLHDILHNFMQNLGQDLKARYMDKLYRRSGFHPYTDKTGTLTAEIADIEDDGHLLLRDEQGQLHRYAFKEVQFVI